MLNDTTRTAVRRHLNSPVPGIPDNNFSLAVSAYDPSMPFFSQPAALEERMLNLRPAEESVLTGLPIAEIILTGTLALAATLTINVTPTDTIGGAPLVTGEHAATMADVGALEPLFSVADSLSLAINAANTPYIALLGPHEPGGPLAAAQASLSLQSIVPQAFAVTVAAAGVGAYVASQGTLPAISATFAPLGLDGQSGGAQTVYGLVPILDALEAQISSSAGFAAFEAVGVVKIDPNELAKRMALYQFYRRRLASFFFGAMGPTFLAGGKRGSGAVV